MNYIEVTDHKRIDYIDIARGLGIIAVIISHSCKNPNIFYPLALLSTLAWSFHMPLFFILSGLCFKEKNAKMNFISLANRLIVPFYFTILLFLLYYLLIGDFEKCKDWLLGGVYCSGTKTPFHIKGVGGIWFLMALFWAKNLLNYIVHLPEYIVFIIISLLAYWGVYSYSRFILPFEIQNGCVGAAFLYIGYLARKYNLFVKNHWPIFVFSIIIWTLAVACNYSRVYLFKCKIDLIQFITSCCACYVVIELSRNIENYAILKKILIWFGRSSLVILCFHIFELHTGLSEIISVSLFSSSNVNMVFLIRLLWCMLFAYLIPKTPYINKVFTN